MTNKEKKTIAFINHTAGLAGAERVLFFILEALPRDLYRPVVFVPEDGPLVERVETLGIEVRRYVNVRQFSKASLELFRQCNLDVWRGFSKRVAGLSKGLKDVEADMVYSNTIFPIEGAFAASHLGLPHIWHIHEMPMDETFYDWILGVPSFLMLASMLSDRVICISDICYSQIAPYILGEKLLIVSSPVKLDLFQRPAPVPSDLQKDRNDADIIISSVGTISKRKAQTDLLDAIELMPEDLLRRCHIWVVGEPGDSHYETVFRERIERLPLRIKLRWLGHRDDVPAILQASDILVHTAHNEPLGLAVIEAMACGKPVVAANSGGVAENVIDKVNGRLVPINDVHALSRAITETIENREAMEEMGKMAKKRVLNYDIGIFTKRIHSILNDTLNTGFDASARRKYSEDFEKNISLLTQSIGHFYKSVQGTGSSPEGGSFLKSIRRAILRIG